MNGYDFISIAQRESTNNILRQQGLSAELSKYKDLVMQADLEENLERKAKLTSYMHEQAGYVFGYAYGLKEFDIAFDILEERIKHASYTRDKTMLAYYNELLAKYKRKKKDADNLKILLAIFLLGGSILMLFSLLSH